MGHRDKQCNLDSNQCRPMVFSWIMLHPLRCSNWDHGIFQKISARSKELETSEMLVPCEAWLSLGAFSSAVKKSWNHRNQKLTASKDWIHLNMLEFCRRQQVARCNMVEKCSLCVYIYIYLFIHICVCAHIKEKNILYAFKDSKQSHAGLHTKGFTMSFPLLSRVDLWS